MSTRRLRRLAAVLIAAVTVAAGAAIAAADPTPGSEGCARVRAHVADRTLVLDAAEAAGGLTRAELAHIDHERAVLAAALRHCTPATSSAAPTQMPSSWAPSLPAPTSVAPSPSPSVSPPTSPSPSPTAPGAWPGPDNTGVPTGSSLSDYTGPCVITTPNAVIDAKRVSCDLVIRTTGVRISRTRILGVVSVADGSPYSFTLVDSEVHAAPGGITPAGATSVGADNFTVLRSEIRGGNRQVYCRRNCLVQDSWLHGTQITGTLHASGIRASQGSRIVHNTIACDVPPNGDAGCSASVTMYGDFEPVADVLVQGNRLVGYPDWNAFCVYGGSSGGKPYSGAARDVRILDNVFERGFDPDQPGGVGRCGKYGPLGDYDPARPGNRFENNRWDTGELIRL